MAKSIIDIEKAKKAVGYTASNEPPKYVFSPSGGANYAITIGGNTINLNQKQVDWIKSRYASAASQSYGDTLDDYTRKSAGLLPSAFEKSYSGSKLDTQLRDLNLPSSKYIAKYIEAYSDWYGDGSTYQFDEDAKSSISKSFKDSWEYEYTLEDQQRKAKGLMPTAIEAKYGDTLRDSQLYEQGLPPESMLTTYVEPYVERKKQDARIDEFYGAVTQKWVTDEAQGKSDEAAKEAAFFDTLKSSEWADVAELYKKRETTSDATYASPFDQYEAEITAQNKAAKTADEPFVSYDDFASKYLEYKKPYLEAKLTDEAAYALGASTLGGAIEQRNKESLQTIAQGDRAGVVSYVQSRKGDDPAAVLADLYNAGASLTRLRNAQDALIDANPDSKNAIREAFKEYQLKYREDRYSAAQNATDSWWGDGQAEARSEARKKRREQNRIFKEYIDTPYKEGSTSTMSVDEATTVFKSHLVYDKNGKVSTESVEAATKVLSDAGVSAPIIKKVTNETLGTAGDKFSLSDAMIGLQSADTIINYDKADTEARAVDVKDRTAIAESARKRLVGGGTMTDFEFDQMLRRNGWGDAVSDVQAAKDYFVESEYPKFAENSEVAQQWGALSAQEKSARATQQWDAMGAETQAAYTASFVENAPFNTEIHKSWNEQIEGQGIGGIFAKAYLNTLSGTVGFLDMVTGGAKWEASSILSQAAGKASAYNRSNQSAASTALGLASDISSEILRMYALNAAGSGIASMFSGANSAIATVSATATSATTKGLNALARAGMWVVKSTPFIATSMGQYYNEAIQSGATVQQATVYGIVCGALEGATEAANTSMWIERGFGAGTFAKELISGGNLMKAGSVVMKARVVNLVASALGEFAEESASYVGSVWMQRATYNKGAKFDITEMLKQGGMGALIGLFGAGASIASYDQSGIISQYLDTEAGMKWATGEGSSAVRDLMFSTLQAESIPADTLSMLQMHDGALSIDDYDAVVRDIDQHSRQMDSDSEKYDADMAKIDAEVSAKQSSVDALTEQVTAYAEDSSPDGVKKWGKAVEALRVAQSELDVETAQATQKRTERTAAFTETTSQHRTALAKAQARILGHSVSMADAFRSEISGIKSLLESGATTMPTALGQEILYKMDAARAGKLADYMEIHAQNAAVTAAEGAGAAQTPTGDNVVMFGQTSQEANASERAFAPEQTAQPANVAMFDQSRSTAGAKAVESLNDRAIEMERQPLSFSKEEMPFVDSAVKAVSSISAEVGTDIKSAFPYAKSIVGMDYVAESMQDIALRVLNGDAEYLDGENLTRQIERVIGTVRIDFVPTEVGLLGHDGAEIRDIRNQIRKTKISIGAYTATGFKYSVDDSIRTDKSLFGTIRLSKSGTAQSADALYYELSNAYPDLFDPEVMNPSDQIRVMADFVRMTYNGRAESLSKIKSGEYVYYLARDVAEKFVVRTMDSYLGVASLRNENGGKADGEAGAVESATGIVAETRSGSTEETERNEAGTGENQGSAKVSQPQNPAEPMGAEATTSNKVATDAKPSSEAMGIVDPRLQEGVSAFRKFGRAAYKRVVSGAAGTERASRVQKKLGIGGASIDSSAQGIRNAQGTAQYILGDALVDINGTRIGRSLTELFKGIPQEKWADFQKYLLAKHTESRMTLEQRGYGKDKPVLASESGALDPDGNATAMDANEAAAIAAKLEAENPNFVAIRDSYRSWWSNFMRSWAVDGGLMTDVQFNALDAKYPDYVPTYRVDKNSVGGATSATRNSVTVSSAIKNATGSTDEIQDIRISLADMVKRYVTMERRNELVQNLFNFAETHTKAAAEFATIFDEESGFSPDVDFVSFDELANKDAAEVKDGQYIIRGFRDGERVSMHVSKDVYDAINYLTNPTDVSVRSQHENEILRGARTISKPIKGVITGYNPFFALMNFARDAQTYFVNTNAKAGDIFVNIGRAVSERAKNSSLWQSYLALGGNTSGYITSQQMTDASVTGKGKVSNAVKKAGEIVGWLGGYTENMFRFAEYINGVNKYGDTAEGRRNAMADAADVTVNFSRSGAYTKAADAFCLYLNANVQGLDKMARTIANNPGRTALRGLSLAAIALLLRYVTDNDDNPHYQNLTNYVKDSSYCIPNVLGERDDNGYCTTFIKIPKSREYGTLIVATLERAARWADGSESFDDAFADLGKDIGTSIGIRMEPLWTAAQAVTTNKNYFGSDIVPMYMQNEAAPDQTTAQTSIISDAISERLYDMGVEISPMVIDYVIDQYGGFYGQLLTSATAKDVSGALGVAENIITDKFVADPLYQSGAVSRFYDTMDEAQYLSFKSQREREKYGISILSADENDYKTLDGYKKQIAALRKQEREILAKDDDTPERKDKIDKIREQINDVANAGLEFWANRGK